MKTATVTNTTRALRLAQTLTQAAPRSCRHVEPGLCDELLLLAAKGATVGELQTACGEARIPDGFRAGGQRVADSAVPGDIVRLVRASRLELGSIQNTIAALTQKRETIQVLLQEP